MVQLVRIVSSNETQTDVTNYFNEAITIKPNSKIALESLKIELNDIVTVTTDNNTFIIQVSVLMPNITVTLNTGIYSQSEFIEELTRAMAASMSYTFAPRNPTTTEINFTEWKPIMFDNKLIIQYCTALPDTGRLNNFKGDLLTGRIVQIGQALVDNFYLGDAYYRNDTDALTPYAYMMTERVGVNGALEYRATVDMNTIPTLAQVTSRTDIYIGLRDITAPIVPITDFQQLRYSIGIFEGATEDEVLISAAIDGIQYGSATFNNPPNAGIRTDVSLRITLQGGFAKFWYSVNDVNAPNAIWLAILNENALDDTYGYSSNFIGYALFGERFNTIYNVAFTSSPYQNSNSSGLSLVNLNSEIQDTETHIKYDSLGAPSQTATTHTLVFGTKVKKLLGFLLDQYTVTSIVNQFLAESALDLGYYTDEIIVELPTEFISSYEGSQNRRRNIIRYIPSDVLQLTNVRSHTFQYPLYLEFQNKEQKVLNYFQVRLLDNEFKPILISGNAGSMTVLLIIEN
jgi:hypothetical protein